MKNRMISWLAFPAVLLMMSVVAQAAASASHTVRSAVTAEADAQLSPANEHGQYRYMIEFNEPGLLHRSGRQAGQRFDIEAPGMRQALDQIQARHQQYRQSMTAATGRALDITHDFLITHSGLAVWLTPEEAVAVARLDGVASVERERVYELSTFRGPWFIGADTVWDGTSTPGNVEFSGEGMVIGVLDTGVVPTHPSFLNDAACGHGAGDVADKLLSFVDCATSSGGACTGGSPVDNQGHGTHVASTAGGNLVGPGASPAPNPPTGFTEVSGVAPCAHIRSYKVCPAQCPQANVQAGMNHVLLHGDVDVMNFSISGGRSPWTDNDRRKLDLVDAGVFVAAAAGNTGQDQPDPVGAVEHRGPWVLSVAATTHDENPLPLLSATGPGTPPTGTQNILVNPGSTTPAAGVITDLPIRRFTGQPALFEGCNPGQDGAPGDMATFPAGYFDGSAALIRRGSCAFTTKIANAFNAGAQLVLVANHLSGPIGMDTTGAPAVPAYSMLLAPGSVLIDFVEANPASATISFEPDGRQGDILADFSFRGPTPAPLLHLTKPDITAPGANIYASVPGGYAPAGGTSMSSPHAAGSAALVRQANPDWSVPEVMSALMMTASRDGFKDDGASTWDWDDVGSGRVDLTVATRAGLVMNETFSNYLAANPSAGGDVRTLNTPSVRSLDCTPSCSWTRTVRNTMGVTTNWEVGGIGDGLIFDIDPADFSFTGDTAETQEITVTVTPDGNLSDRIYFGSVVFTETGSQAPEQHITVAIRGVGAGSAEIEVDPDSLAATAEPDSSSIQTLTLSNLGGDNLDWSLFEGGTVLWADDFDGYATGQIHGQGGWAGWQNNPALGAQVVDTQANSAPNSLQIGGNDDPVRPLAGISSGQVTVTAWQFLPSGFSGTSYFILLNTYNHAGTGLNWSAQASFNSATGTVVNEGISGGSLSLITNQWVELRVEIDLDEDTQSFYYDGQLLYSGSWTDEVSGGGASSLGAVNLFANGASAAFYDDLSVTTGDVPGCDGLGEVPWLSAAPTSGALPASASTDVDVTLDATGLAVDQYQATLCVLSNDPFNPVVPVPVTLNVAQDQVFHDRFEDQ